MKKSIIRYSYACLAQDGLCNHPKGSYVLSTDVLDISWSPDDRYLASGSVDNTVNIWNAEKFPGKGFDIII